jgi:hypothetical protein
MSRRNGLATCLAAVPHFVIGVALIVLVFPPRLVAQEPTRAPTVTLLKRVAEAVDGHRTGGDVFVVVNHDSATVDAVVPTNREATALANRLGQGHGVVGPVRGSIDLGPMGSYVPSYCVHDGFTSEMRLKICNSVPMLRGEILSMSLVVKMRNGSTRTINLPNGSDAIFLSMSAYDKFVFPYYARIIGVDATAAWRQQMIRELPQR